MIIGLALVCLFLPALIFGGDFQIYNTFPDSGTVRWQRSALAGSLLGGTLTYLYFAADEAYYQDRQVRFHFAKDSRGRLKWFENRHRAMDKFGHIYSTSLFSQNIYFMSRWSGYGNKTSSYLAALMSTSIMAGLEVWDAHFERWGFSAGDFVANLAGGILPVLQQNSAFVQNFDYKMSYNFLRPKSEDPGIHDYENMSFWFTVNPAGLLAEHKPRWLPDFINLAVGVGLESYRSQRREIYLSLDYNLKKVRSRYLFVRQLIAILDRFHFPAPAIRIAPGYVAYGLFF